jgi:phage terminase small subunit
MAADGYGLTPKQEAFACAYVETGNASEAYRRVYSAGRMTQRAVEVEASRLLANPKVTLRVSNLKSEHATRHNVTVDSVTEMLKADRELARELNQPAAAVSAIMGLAKLHGLIIDKSKVDVSNHEDALRALQDRMEPRRPMNGATLQ